MENSKTEKVCYALYPGPIFSEAREPFYISAPHLARLYGVPLNKCIIIDTDKPETYRGRDLSKFIKLRVRPSGNYILPSA